MLADGTDRQSGFTLIETIVALAILGTAMVTFFAFLSNALGSAHRMELASVAYDRRTNALEIATAINPMELPEGSLNLGPYSIAWSANLLGNVRQSSRYPAGAGIFKVALYRINFTFPDTTDVPSIEVTKLGYRRDDVPNPVSPTGTGSATGGSVR
jgi:prepilin-type N-terminal cleavage/methylation domain-containing protein